MKTYRHLDELHAAYRLRSAAIRERLRDYARIPEERYFYELAYCLMTPQSSAVNAGKAQQKFEALRFHERDFDPVSVLEDREHYIRFHKTKAKRLMEMKSKFPAVLDVLRSSFSAPEKREWLAAAVNGISYKEATHFLRNIWKNGGLAILDRHILKNLKYHAVIRNYPAALTKKKYLAIEKRFLRFAEEIGISADELDLLFWSNETGEILK